MPNDTRSGLKISGNRSYGGMNPPQSPDINIIEAVWDHLYRERNKRQPTSKEELWDVLQEAWRTIELYKLFFCLDPFNVLFYTLAKQTFQ